MDLSDFYDVIEKQPIINVGVLGHVAHGKSTIVRQITNIRTQKHSNEQKTGRTLKLGYANIKIFQCKICNWYLTRPSNINEHPNCDNNNCNRNSSSSSNSTMTNDQTTTKLVNHISFVDAPGHEFLMTTMLNGSAVMDCAILVIAGNEKVPQPQTQEHLIATQIMDLNNIIIVQNKLDLITRDEAMNNYNEITTWLKGTCNEGRPIVPISAYTGNGIQNIIQALAQLRPSPNRRNPNEVPIFACVRSFDVNKPGDNIIDLKGGVLGGTLLQGTLTVGDKIQIRPGFKKSQSEFTPITCTLMSIQSEKNVLERVIPGGLIALCTDIDPMTSGHDSLVGSIIGHPGNMPENVMQINIKYFILNTVKQTVKTLKKNNIIKITYLSRTIQGTISDVSKKHIIIIDLDEPICLYHGCDKLSVLFEISKQWKLIAVGKILSEKTDEKPNEKTNDLQTHLETYDDFGKQLPPYNEMLNQIVKDCCLKQTQKVTSLTIIPPSIQRQGGKRTLWKNFGLIANDIGKTIEHFKRFISAELITTADINENTELLLYGNFNEGHFESLIRKYVKEYCKCLECNCYKTTLSEQARFDIITCMYCGRSRSVSKNKEHL